MKTKRKKQSVELKKVAVMNLNMGAYDDPPKGSLDNPYSLQEFLEILETGWPGGYVIGLGYVAQEVVIIASGSSSLFYSDPFLSSEPNSFSFPYIISSSSDYISWPEDLYGSDLNSNQTGGGSNNNPSGGTNGGNNSGGSGSSGSSPNVNTYPQGVKNYSEFNLEYSFFPGLGLTASYLYNCVIVITGRQMRVYVEVVYPNSEVSYWGTVELYINDVLHSSYSLNPLEGTNFVGGDCRPVGQCSFELPRYGNVVVRLFLGIEVSSITGNFLDSDSRIIYPYNN